MTGLHAIGESPGDAQLAYVAGVNLIESTVPGIRIIARLTVPLARRIAGSEIECGAREVRSF